MDDITERIKSIVTVELGLSQYPKESDRFTEDFNVDSLDRVSLMIAIEDSFALNISDADAEQLLTVDSLIQYVGQRVKG